jgi:hypothetical protein
MTGLTREERKVIAFFGIAFVNFQSLPVCHPGDVDEARRHVHALQNMVLARAAVRAHPIEYFAVEGFE